MSQVFFHLAALRANTYCNSGLGFVYTKQIKMGLTNLFTEWLKNIAIEIFKGYQVRKHHYTTKVIQCEKTVYSFQFVT